ncbi:hypothetical protein TNCV_4422721 [Trichonephila clavipes]|nr:hypothetical protein TNCV_4422721 [Trichonephila clavipes]
MIAASPLSPDEYAMRIATQTESALICKEYSSPFIVSPIPVFPAPSCKQTTTVQSSGYGKTRYRSSSRLCRVSSDFFRCLPPISSGLHLERAEAVTRFRLTTRHDFLEVCIHWCVLAVDAASPLCGNARMNGEPMLQCSMDSMNTRRLNFKWSRRQFTGVG